ncbi:hypothetical protein ACHAW5_007822 [Stephanodiscus triporus]|uniref:Lon N-terminal domain-containing protein n=1 Tax=Stephanodiscus triporus TaxID=2934178 RepID=A0ABD3NQX2_9STRA
MALRRPYYVIFFVVVVALAAAAAFSTSNPLARPHTSSSGIPPRLLSSAPKSAIDDYDDFAEFSSSSSSTPYDENEGIVADDHDHDDDDDDPFLSSLQLRVRQVRERSDRLPLMVLDAMLPRQVLRIQIQHPTLKSLMRHRVGMETPTLGMIGTARVSTGRTAPLRAGVEVEIIEMGRSTSGIGPSPHGTVVGIGIGDDDGEEEEEERPWDVSLRASRRFVIEGDVERVDGGWTEARVRYLDSSIEEEGEIRRFSSLSGTDGANDDDDDSSGGGVVVVGDRLSVARAISQSRAFTEPNPRMKDNASLVERWIELARQNERYPGQIDALLRQLGDIPPEHEPTERALWVGALINPLPGMGVAMEIRPALLLSKRAEERVQVALDGILGSIRHMDGTSRMW